MYFLRPTIEWKHIFARILHSPGDLAHIPTTYIQQVGVVT